MADLSEIRALVSERLELVRQAKDEYDRLEKALVALGGPTEKTPDLSAPYGRKADGTPRKRPGRRAPTKQATEITKLNVTTAGVPAVKDGAEPAYVTQGS